MNNFTLPLDFLEAVLNTVGGKGASLNRLVRAGFPVPPGFVVTTAAYRAFVQANGLEEQMVALCQPALAGDPASLENASRAIRQLLEQGSIPPTVAADVRQAYAKLGPSSPAVAVRSSATAEDLPKASFAGQQETYLNVCGEEALLEAVRRCWSSLWTARAMAYRARQFAPGQNGLGGINPATVSMAVIVQQLVPAEAAGVLFTVNPVTGKRGEAVINAAWGLGEAVVSGQVTPDTVVVDKATGQVKDVKPGDKDVMTAPAAEGTQLVSVPPDRRLQQVLTPAQAAELARLGREIEAHFDSPQDIEWAIASEKVYILQSRPVTGLPVAPAVPGDDDWPALELLPAQPFDLWSRANVEENWPYPLSPLLWASLSLGINNGIRYAMRDFGIPYLGDIQWGKRFYGRLYLNVGAIGHIYSQELGLPASFVQTALGGHHGPATRDKEGFHLLRFLRRLPAFLGFIMGRMGTERELEALFPQVDAWDAELSAQDLDRLGDSQLWAALGTTWVERATQVMNLNIAVGGSAMTGFSMLQRLVGQWCGRQELAHDLITGLSGVYAAEMGPALWQMAQRLRELGLESIVLDRSPVAALDQLRETPQAEPVLHLLDAFLQRHGHRCPNEGEWLHPRWAEAPELVVEIVAGYLRAGDRVNPVGTEARQRRRREEATAWVEEHLDPLRRAVFHRILASVQHAVRMRDNSKHYAVKVAFPICRIYRVMGRRWAERGWLRHPNDIFFLGVPEAGRVIETGDPTAAGLDLLALVAGRRKAYEHWFGIEALDVIGPDGQAIEIKTPPQMPGTVLEGIAASGGSAQGVVRIIHDPRQTARLQPGDILVTRSTDPGWTPVFPLLSGLVLETGGQLSHGAIVAREYGVPAVVNVRDAMQHIQDGQAITVDGTAGRVFLKEVTY